MPDAKNTTRTGAAANNTAGKADDHIKQLKQSVIIIGAAMSVAFVVLLYVAFQQNPPAYYLRDPLRVAEMVTGCCYPDMGLVSNIGIVIWSMSAGVAFFTAALIHYRQLHYHQQEPASRRLSHAATFFAATGAFTLFLVIDDLFLLHERIFVELGVPEIVTYGAYFLIAAAYAFFFRLTIVKMRPEIILAAVGCFALSMVMDKVGPNDAQWVDFAEDGGKFLGILLWAAFIFAAGLRAAAASPGQAEN